MLVGQVGKICYTHNMPLCQFRFLETIQFIFNAKKVPVMPYFPFYYDWTIQMLKFREFLHLYFLKAAWGGRCEIACVLFKIKACLLCSIYRHTDVQICFIMIFDYIIVRLRLQDYLGQMLIEYRMMKTSINILLGIQIRW